MMRSSERSGSLPRAFICWLMAVRRRGWNSLWAMTTFTLSPKMPAISCIPIAPFLQAIQNDALGRERAAGAGRPERGQGKSVSDNARRDDRQRVDCAGDHDC